MDFYPAAICSLIVRFDEFGKQVLNRHVPEKPTKNIKGSKDPRRELDVVSDPDAPESAPRFLLLPKGSAPQPGAPGLLGTIDDKVNSEDGLTHAIRIVPKEAQWKQNGIRNADTLSIKFKFVDCPIDPRCVRSAGVVFALGVVSADEFQAGVEGKTREKPPTANQAESMNMIPSTYFDASGTKRTNIRFKGYVDKWEVDWSDSMEPMVNIECRDLTQSLIDTEVPPKASMEVSEKIPIDRAIADFLAYFPAMAGLSVEYRSGQPLQASAVRVPTLADAYADKTSHQQHVGIVPTGGGGATGGGKLSVWDYLTDVCGVLGHNIRVEDTIVVIQSARTLMAGKSSARGNDPFEGRSGPDGKAFTNRRFIYGHNVLSLKTSRNYAKHAPTNVEVTSYSNRFKRKFVARYPSDKPGKGIPFSPPGQGGADEKWTVIGVKPDITDQTVLLGIAQQAYENLGRQELTMNVKTRNLTSFGGKNLDPDVLDMRPGDAFELLVQRASDVDPDEANANSLLRIEKAIVVQEKSAEFMQALGFEPSFAKAYAKAYTDAGFQTIFRLKELNVNWSVDQGVDLELVGVNYIEIRMDKKLPSEEAASESGFEDSGTSGT